MFKQDINELTGQVNDRLIVQNTKPETREEKIGCKECRNLI